MDRYQKNKKILSENYSYDIKMEHDACGVGMIAATDGKKTRKIVDYGIEALKAFCHLNLDKIQRAFQPRTFLYKLLIWS